MENDILKIGGIGVTLLGMLAAGVRLFFWNRFKASEKEFVADRQSSESTIKRLEKFWEEAVKKNEELHLQMEVLRSQTMEEMKKRVHAEVRLQALLDTLSDAKIAVPKDEQLNETKN